MFGCVEDAGWRFLHLEFGENRGRGDGRYLRDLFIAHRLAFPRAHPAGRQHNEKGRGVMALWAEWQCPKRASLIADLRVVVIVVFRACVPAVASVVRHWCCMPDQLIDLDEVLREALSLSLK